MQTAKKKKCVARLSIISNLILSFLKVLSGIMTGSLCIISEAIHSASDLFASFITFFSVSKSSEPADEDHPFGHGRYEDMSGFIEGVLIILAAIYIIWEAIRKIIIGEFEGNESNIGIIVMFVAVIVNIIVSSLLFKVAKETNSISLYADGEHLRTDVYSSFGVFLGLILIKITGHYVLDSIIALIVASLILITGKNISKRALKNLLDYSLPKEDIEKIKITIDSMNTPAILKKDSIKARQMGPEKEINLVLRFPEDTSICVCHKICDEIENKIQSLYVNSTISVHFEPVCYKKNCLFFCTKECTHIKNK